MSGRFLYLGVDGGGTKTEFVCIDGEAREVARTTTRTTYHLQVGLDGAIRQISDGVETICRALAITPAELAFTFFGLPAFGEDSVIDPQLDEACGRILGHDRYICANDMVCGWAGSLGGEDGINLVAGTGSIGYGERNGRTARAGGWGEVFGDEGSAYWIAVQGLNAFSKMSDGRLPAGPLHRHLFEALGLRADLDLCARMMGERGMSRDEIASLAPIVSRAASQGDEVASEILVRAAQELAQLAIALRTSLGFGLDATVLLSWSGGVLTQAPAVRAALASVLASAGGFKMVEPLHSPSFGAALYARRLAGKK